MNIINKLPKEIVNIICEYATYKSISNLSLTCKGLLNISKLPSPNRDVTVSYKGISIRTHISQSALPICIADKLIIYYDNYRVKGYYRSNVQYDYLIIWGKGKYLVYIQRNNVHKEICLQISVNHLYEVIEPGKKFMDEESLYRLTVFVNEFISTQQYCLPLTIKQPEFRYLSVDGYAFKFDRSVTEILIDPHVLQSYNTILFELNDVVVGSHRMPNYMIAQAYFEAKRGKQVYICDNTTSQIHMRYARDNIEFYQMTNLHVNNKLHPKVRFDCIVSNLYANFDDLLWNYPDIITYLNDYNLKHYLQMPKLNCEGFPNILLSHISRFTSNKIELIDNVNVNMNLLEAARYHNIPVSSSSLCIELTKLRNSKSYQYACNIIEVSPLTYNWDLLTDPSYNERIVFESYLNLWYGRNKETAEKFVMDNLDKFIPSETLWSPNKIWYNSELADKLSSKWK